MRTKELAPIKERVEYYESIERAIVRLLLDELYKPLAHELKNPDILKNAKDDPIEDGLRTGRISFYRGRFTGKFNAAITRALKKLGAKWDRKDSAFDIHLDKLPDETVNAIYLSESRFKRTLQNVDRRLAQILPDEIANKFHAEQLFDKTLWHIDKKIKDSMAGITVGPDLTDEQRQRLAKEYSENLKPHIQDFTKKEILRLRSEIQKNVFGGFRYETLVKHIQDSYAVSQNKAKFLARQETSLMMAKFKTTRYEAAGVNEYRWTCVAGSAKHPVRPMHKVLDGKTFRFDDPPKTNVNGDRNNPGEDFNCRCTARPIVKF